VRSQATYVLMLPSQVIDISPENADALFNWGKVLHCHGTLHWIVGNEIT
jgi:hypothetical protein